MIKHLFSPRSARAALNELRPAAESLCRLWRALERAQPKAISPDQPVDADYFALVVRLHATLGRIRRQGVEVQDARRGRLGFPARRAGQIVLLCWEVGEPTLGFWRAEGSVGARRLPLDEDGPWEEV